MAYVINRYNGETLTVLADGSLDVTTSVSLVGRNYVGYGEIQNENFVFLLENFRNTNPPLRPLEGQLWYNSSSDTLQVYDGQNWKSIGSAEIGTTAPNGTTGSFWLKNDTNQLFTYNNGWNLVGPEAVANFNTTRLVSVPITASNGQVHSIIKIICDDEVIGIFSKNEFTISTNDAIPGFTVLIQGLTFSSTLIGSDKKFKISGELKGNSETTTRLKTPITINETSFDGQDNITITASTKFNLIPGDYISGTEFNGSAATTWSVDASSANLIGTVVARNSEGGFSAGTVTANFVGNLTGNVTASTGTSRFNVIEANQFVGAVLSGNALSASRLETSRKINGVGFDGTRDITVPAASSTLVGTTLSNSVIYSSLTDVGRLNSLRTEDAGIKIGTNDSLTLSVDETENSIIKAEIDGRFIGFYVADSVRPSDESGFKFVSSDVNLQSSGQNRPALIPTETLVSDLGSPTNKWKTAYAETFSGAGADLAEKYLADAEYDEGTVLEFGGVSEVTLATYQTSRIAGVVSASPGYIMNSALTAPNSVNIALQGRVPVKVIGTVKKGDMMVSAGNGLAKACHTPTIGTVIGKSLQDFDGDQGIIEIVVGRL